MFELFRLSALVALVFSAIAALSLSRGVPTTSEKNFKSSQPVVTTFRPYAATASEAWVARYNGPETSTMSPARSPLIGRGTSTSQDPVRIPQMVRIISPSNMPRPGNNSGSRATMDRGMMGQTEGIAVDLSGNVYVTGESIGGAGYFGFATISTTQPDRGSGSLGIVGSQPLTTFRSRSRLIRPEVM